LELLKLARDIHMSKWISWISLFESSSFQAILVTLGILKVAPHVHVSPSNHCFSM